MINIIKTAIITIIISFASGLLLDYYKNLAPRILCNIRNGIPVEINSKKIYSYIITVNNASKKTIHELTINIQSPQTNLKSTEATITKGLKFDSSIKDNILDVYIPFLSKGDKFSATVYVENQYAVNNKPVIVIRSPENFKEIDSIEKRVMKKGEAIVPNKKNDFTTVMNKSEGAQQTVNKEILHGNKHPSNNEKTMIIIVSIILVMIIGVLGKSYFKGMSTNAPTPIVKTIVHKQSAGSKGEKAGTSDTTSPKGGTTTTSGTKAPAGGTTTAPGTTAPAAGTTGTPGTTTPTSGTTGTPGTTTPTSGTTGTSGVTPPASGTTGTSGSTTPTTGTTGTPGK